MVWGLGFGVLGRPNRGRLVPEEQLPLSRVAIVYFALTVSALSCSLFALFPSVLSLRFQIFSFGMVILYRIREDCSSAENGFMGQVFVAASETAHITDSTSGPED